jgi:hypothetical protein
MSLLATAHLLVSLLRNAFRSRHALLLENLALRQQLAVLARSERRPSITPLDRLFWVGLRHACRSWRDLVVIVQPETVVAWHRALWRGYWRLGSRRRRGRPRTSAELRALIRRMARENRWGAPRMHGELSKLGFRVSERTISRYLRTLRPRGERGGQSWKTFLSNHRDVLAAMDFLVVPTATFRLRYVLMILHHDRRRVLHCNVTEHPASAWVCQQLRAAFPGDAELPKYLLMDRDAIFSKRVSATVRSFGVKPLRTGFQSPWHNGACERLIGSIRRELLDRVIVLSEAHLRRLLRNYVAYYHADRTHLILEKDTPDTRPITARPSAAARVVALPRVGGLHHRYVWRAAA